MRLTHTRTQNDRRVLFSFLPLFLLRCLFRSFLCFLYFPFFTFYGSYLCVVNGLTLSSLFLSISLSLRVFCFRHFILFNYIYFLSYLNAIIIMPLYFLLLCLLTFVSSVPLSCSLLFILSPASCSVLFHSACIFFLKSQLNELPFSVSLCAIISNPGLLAGHRVVATFPSRHTSVMRVIVLIN
jgi:hypothetical protein